MVIAVNTRFLIPGKMEGYGYFVEEIFFRMAAAHPEHRFYFLFDRAVPEGFSFPENVTPLVVGPPARHPALWYYWYNISVPQVLRRIGAQVFVSPDGFCSLTTKIPQCLVVHDLAYLYYPSFIRASHLWYYRRYTKRCLRKARQVVTVSAYSKEDIIKHFHTDPARISVVHNATHPAFVPLADDLRESVKSSYAGGTEYFVYTGTIHPRKNLINLLKAFSLFKNRLRSNMKLVIAGRMAWKNEAFVKLLSTYKYRSDVVLTGYLSKEELVKVVGAAYALVYPSLYEGFGVPPLEALQCGVPAIVSEVSALPEVGGDAYLYMDPQNPTDMADKMMLLYKDEALRSRLIANGSSRLKLYSWDQSAQQMWQAVMAAVE